MYYLFKKQYDKDFEFFRNFKRNNFFLNWRNNDFMDLFFLLKKVSNEKNLKCRVENDFVFIVELSKREYLLLVFYCDERRINAFSARCFPSLEKIQNTVSFDVKNMVIKYSYFN